MTTPSLSFDSITKKVLDYGEKPFFKNVIPHLDVNESTRATKSNWARIAEIALSTFILLGTFLSMLFLSHYHLVGFAIGIVFADQVRGVVQKVAALFQANLPFKVILILHGLAFWPILLLALPVLVSSYWVWSAKRAPEDKCYFLPQKKTEQMDLVNEIVKKAVQETLASTKPAA